MASSTDFAPFLKLLEDNRIGHYAKTLYENKFSLNNLGGLTPSDLRTLHIRGKDAQTLLGLAEQLKEGEQATMLIQRLCGRRASRTPSTAITTVAVGRSPSRRGGGSGHHGAVAAAPPPASSGDDDPVAAMAAGSEQDGAAAGSTAVTATSQQHPDYPPFTATVPTANECARQATIYLNHYHVDRRWPQPSSKLAQSLNLSTAAPESKEEPLYNLSMDAANHSSATAVMPPCKHTHGHSARFCPVCAEHVNDGMRGSWQYQTTEKVLLGEGLFDEVSVWKPFDGPESIRIEFTYKKRKPGLKVKGTFLDLDAMTWGEKPVRRVEGDAVPFPTLRAKDLTRVPAASTMQQQGLHMGIDKLQVDFLLASERTARLAIMQEEQLDLANVLAMIAAMMEKLFSDQIAALEAEEAAARAAIVVSDLEKELDKLWDAFENSMRDVALHASRNVAEQIAARQRAMLEDMETLAREDIENEEAAFRANLEKLGNLLNAQIKSLLDAQKHQAAMAKLRGRKHKLDSLRCPVCRLTDCVFFKNKWQNHWRHFGGALDMLPPSSAGDTLSALMAKACEFEYKEYIQNLKASKKAKKLKQQLLLAANGDGSPSNSRGASPIRPTSSASTSATAHNSGNQRHQTSSMSLASGRMDDTAYYHTPAAAAASSTTGIDRNSTSSPLGDVVGDAATRPSSAAMAGGNAAAAADATMRDLFHRNNTSAGDGGDGGRGTPSMSRPQSAMTRGEQKRSSSSAAMKPAGVQPTRAVTPFTAFRSTKRT